MSFKLLAVEDTVEEKVSPKLTVMDMVGFSSEAIELQEAEAEEARLSSQLEFAQAMLTRAEADKLSTEALLTDTAAITSDMVALAYESLDTSITLLGGEPDHRLSAEAMEASPVKSLELAIEEKGGLVEKLKKIIKTILDKLKAIGKKIMKMFGKTVENNHKTLNELASEIEKNKYFSNNSPVGHHGEPLKAISNWVNIPNDDYYEIIDKTDLCMISVSLVGREYKVRDVCISLIENIENSEDFYPRTIGGVYDISLSGAKKTQMTVTEDSVSVSTVDVDLSNGTFDPASVIAGNMYYAAGDESKGSHMQKLEEFRDKVLPALLNRLAEATTEENKDRVMMLNNAIIKLLDTNMQLRTYLAYQKELSAAAIKVLTSIIKEGEAKKAGEEK